MEGNTRNTWVDTPPGSDQGRVAVQTKRANILLSQQNSGAVTVSLLYQSKLGRSFHCHHSDGDWTTLLSKQADSKPKPKPRLITTRSIPIRQVFRSGSSQLHNLDAFALYDHKPRVTKATTEMTFRVPEQTLEVSGLTFVSWKGDFLAHVTCKGEGANHTARAPSSVRLEK